MPTEPHPQIYRENLAACLDDILCRNPGEVTIAAWGNLMHALFCGVPQVSVGPRYEGWHKNAMHLLADAGITRDRVKIIKGVALLLLATFNGHAEAALSFADHYEVIADLLGKSPEDIEPWREFASRVEHTWPDWPNPDNQKGTEAWIVLTHEDISPILEGAERDNVAGCPLFLAFPMIFQGYLADPPDNLMDRMIVGNDLRPIVEAIQGKPLIVWDWRSVVRSIRQTNNGDLLVTRDAVTYAIKDQALDCGETPDDLWSLGFDGGPSLDPSGSEISNNEFVARWTIDVISFLEGIKDQQRMFSDPDGIHKPTIEWARIGLDLNSDALSDTWLPPHNRPEIRRKFLEKLAESVIRRKANRSDYEMVRARRAFVGLLAFFVCRLESAPQYEQLLLDIPAHRHEHRPDLSMFADWLLGTYVVAQGVIDDPWKFLVQRNIDECIDLVEIEPNPHRAESLRQALHELITLTEMGPTNRATVMYTLTESLIPFQTKAWHLYS